MNTARLLAFNLGSVTLKAASFEFDSEVPAADTAFVEEARIELAVTGDASRDLQATLDALPPQARTPDVVVHRIVHGGSFEVGRALDEPTFEVLDALAALAPLHQPVGLALARAARLYWPQARHGADFDTAFHAHLAPWSRRLPLPADLDAAGVRRHGFHGLAFASALRRLEALAPGASRGRVIIAHLGGGCSVAAIEGGRSIDATMGMTPLGGVPMPTRSGDLDPGVIFHLLRLVGDAARLEQRLLHEAGLAGIAGYGDMRRLLDDARPDAVLAVEQFTVRIAQAIAAMAIAIGGMDHVVFCGGSGSRAPRLRDRIAVRLLPLGLVLDPQRNCTGAARLDAGRGPGAWRIDVDEELELAESTRAWAFPVPANGPAPLPDDTTEVAP